MIEPTTAEANLKEIGDFLKWRPERQKKFKKRLVTKLKDLQEDAQNKCIPRALYTLQNQSTLQEMFNHFCKENDDMDTDMDTIEWLSSHWYQQVRGNKNGGLRKRTQDDGKRSLNAVLPNTNGNQGTKPKNVRRTQKQVKMGYHWECLGCNQAFVRRTLCYNHIKKCHKGCADAVEHKQGQNPMALPGNTASMVVGQPRNTATLPIQYSMTSMTPQGSLANFQQYTICHGLAPDDQFCADFPSVQTQGQMDQWVSSNQMVSNQFNVQHPNQMVPNQYSIHHPQPIENGMPNAYSRF